MRRRLKPQWRHSPRVGGRSKRKPRLLVPGLPRRCLERPGIKVPWTPRYYLKAQITQGADRDSSLLAKRHLPALPCPMASRKTCRLDNGHCAGAAKNSGEEKVIASQRKTKTKACEQGKCDNSRRPGAISTLLPT
jgi:hypothetical protein